MYDSTEEPENVINCEAGITTNKVKIDDRVHELHKHPDFFTLKDIK